MPYESQHRLTDGPLLDETGRLAETGYATRLCRRYDRSAIRAGKLRVKEWDYYLVTDGEAALALTIADNSYMGLDSVSLLWLGENPRERTTSMMRLFPMGKTGLPATSERGVTQIAAKKYCMKFECDGTTRVLTAHLDDFMPGKPLDVSVTLRDMPRDSMVIATPFAGKPKHFYYNQKINCMRAEGSFTFDGQTHVFSPERSAAVLDWGRGVWTYRNTWYWSSLNAYLDGAPFGFNLGYGFGDTSAATENMLFYRGAAHKLERVVFEIPRAANGREDFMKPWRIHDGDGRLELGFEPILDRANLTDAIVLKSDQHQVFGRFTGRAVLDDGTELRPQGLVGFAEKVYNCW